MDPILIDECLSPRLVAVAQARGLVAMHVAWLNLEGTDDWHVASLAAERNYVVSRTTVAISSGSTPSLRSTTA